MTMMNIPLSRPAFLLAALAAALTMPLPAHATCTPPRFTPLVHGKLLLTGPGGRNQIVRATGRDGRVTLRRLRPGTWTVVMVDGQKTETMQVARDGRLEISAGTRSYSCSPPGGPARHAEIRELKQINRPATP